MKLVHRLLPPLFLLAVLAFFIANCWLLDRATVAFTRSASPRDTLVGLPEPRFFTDPDAYAWLSHTRDMLLAGDWRIRHTHMDNAPYGRPMHWSHLLIWELAAHARLLQRLRPGMLLSPALEIAGRCAMPFFYLLFLPPLYLLILRRTGFLPAALFLLLSVVFPFFSILATPLQPDHHIFQYLFPIATILCLSFAGWGLQNATSSYASSPALSHSFWLRLPPVPTRRDTRRLFFIAGFLHAALLWIGASVWLFIHVAFCLAALSITPVWRRHASSAVFPPLRDSPWLVFAIAFLPAAVLFYCLEYVPALPGMRLEVNHPLYWLFAAGSFLFLALLPLNRASRNRVLVPLAVLLALPLPLALLFGPAHWHSMHDPFLQRLHAAYIVEFRSLLESFREHPLFFLSELRILLVVPCLLPLACRRASRTARPHAVLLATFFLLSFWQRRWMTQFGAALLPAAVLCLPLLLHPTSSAYAPRLRKIAPVVFVLFLIDSAWLVTASTLDALHAAVNRYTPSHWVTCDLSKRSALRLALASSGQNWTLAGFAPDAPVFYYFGGIPSIASYYWENAAGWHAEAPLLADTSDAAANARALAAERHISRILIRTDSFLPELYAYVAHDITNAYAAQFHTLLGRLAHAPRTMPPFWLTPDADLSAALSQSTLYALPGDNCYAKTNLLWSAYIPSP